MEFDKLYKLAGLPEPQKQPLPAMDGNREIYFITTDFLDLTKKVYYKVERMHLPHNIEQWDNETQYPKSYHDVNMRVFTEINDWVYRNLKDTPHYNTYTNNNMRMTVAENLEKLFEPYQKLQGKWGCYPKNRGGRESIIGFEVDTDYYRTTGITDTLQSNIHPEENIIDW
jgi:hypothetical protein